MPTSEFQTALTERIEFAVFVAYEGWVRASGYASANPYDVLARVLPGLPESLQSAVASHGGWAVFEPIGGIPTDAARQLIGEMASQVVSARIAALAPHAPDGNLLTQVVVDAIGRAVAVFIDDPESWRLALSPGERGQIAALGEHPIGQGHADSSAAEAPPPAQMQMTPADEGGDYGAPGTRVVQTLERVLNGSEASGRPDLSQFFNLSEVWWVKTSGTLPVSNSAINALGSLLIDAGSSGLLKSLFDDDAPVVRGSPGGNGLADGTPAIPDPPYAEPGGDRPHDSGGVGSGHGATAGLPEALAAIIDRWIELLNKANFYRVDEDGSIYRLNQQEAAQVGDTLISVLVRRAQLDLALPTLPGEQPAGHDTASASGMDTDTAATSETTTGMPPADPSSGLGSDTLHYPPASPAPGSDPPPTLVVHETPPDPVPDHVAGMLPPDMAPTVLPLINHPGQDHLLA